MESQADQLEGETMTAIRSSGQLDELTLSDSRDMLTRSLVSTDLASRINQILEQARSGDEVPGGLLSMLQTILEEARSMPHGVERVASMNTIVRTIGSRENLATYLDLLRLALDAHDGPDRDLAKRSARGRMHCVYGWAGQTLMLPSGVDPTAGTSPVEEDLGDFLGYPPAEWDMSIHIWQPNPLAKGFKSTKRFEQDVIVEPPHSHPFSFVSYVAMGEMWQSIYDEGGPSDGRLAGRYVNVPLERVDGVWPPHQRAERVVLRTVEDRVLLRAGDSYYMPTRAVHDVEVVRSVAATNPTVTLFLCAEATVKPNAYLSAEMADFHRMNPNLKDEEAVPLTADQWRSKLLAVSAYLNGESDMLELADIVQCKTAYGFMHT